MSDLSFKFKTERTVVLVDDLMTRQMAMMIFVCLENPVRFQILSKRFYNGIQPHWFRQIKGRPMEIRLTEEIGVRHVELIDFEYPTVDYIAGLTSAQKRTLQMIGVSKSTDTYGRHNILLSTGEQSKVNDW